MNPRGTGAIRMEEKMAEQKQKPQDGYVRAKEAAQILGVSVTTIWNWVTDKLHEGFPRPIRISDRVTVFPRAEIIAYAESKRVG